MQPGAPVIQFTDMGSPISVLHCAICAEPVDLTADLSADENGKAVHEDCYVKRVSGSWLLAGDATGFLKSSAVEVALLIPSRTQCQSSGIIISAHWIEAAINLSVRGLPCGPPNRSSAVCKDDALHLQSVG